MGDEVKLDTDGLDKLKKLLMQKSPTARIGVLSTTSGRSDESGLNNAEVGAASEFGSVNVTRRSWLRVPLMENFQLVFDKSKDLSEDSLKVALKDNSFLSLMKIVGKIGERVVQIGFGTAGYGKWAAWKNNYSNKTGQILIDSAQLVKAVTSDVKE